LEFILRNKIRLGISGCNFGSKVRWNRAGWNRLDALGREKNDFTWVPVCPEVLSGFGVPRPRMKLVSGNGDDFWHKRARMKNSFGFDVSEAACAGCITALHVIKKSGVEGFVFMEGSPTCGVYRTTLKNQGLGKPPGVFGSLLLNEELFLIPALDLESPWKWWDWSRRLYAFCWLKRQRIENMEELYAAWHSLKFICQESDEKTARDIGRMIAGKTRERDSGFFSNFKKNVFMLLRKPSTLERISGAMVKHYAHYKKYFGLKSKEITPPDSKRGRRQFIMRLRDAEKKAFEAGYYFGGHPVVYRPER
jgi:uncharacterized protein YbbK (DUF523 family)